MAVTTYSELQTAVANEAARSDLTSRIVEFIARGEDRIARDLRIKEMESSVDLVAKAAVAITAANVGGTADVITLTNTTPVASNSLGDTYSFTAEGTNTSTVTVNVDGIGAVALNKGDGTEALAAGDIVNGSTYHIYYDGTRFRLVPPGGIPLPSNFLQSKRLFISTDPVTQPSLFDPINFWATYAVNRVGLPKAYTVEGFNLILGPRPDGTYYGKLLFYRRFTALATTSTNWLLTNHHGLYLSASMVELFTYTKEGGKVMQYATMYDEILDALHKADKSARMSGAPMQSRSGVFAV